MKNSLIAIAIVAAIGGVAAITFNQSHAEPVTPQMVAEACKMVGVAVNSTRATLSPQDVYNIVMRCQQSIEACGQSCPTYARTYELGQAAIRELLAKYGDEIQTY